MKFNRVSILNIASSLSLLFKRHWKSFPYRCEIPHPTSLWNISLRIYIKLEKMRIFSRNFHSFFGMETFTWSSTVEKIKVLYISQRIHFCWWERRSFSYIIDERRSFYEKLEFLICIDFRLLSHSTFRMGNYSIINIINRRLRLRALSLEIFDWNGTILISVWKSYKYFQKEEQRKYFKSLWVYAK